MADWTFYHSAQNPTGLTGTVGGLTSSTEVNSTLNELFAHISAPPSGTTTEAYQYRKIHVKNTSSVVMTGVKIWLDDVEHTGQISFGLENTSGDFVSNPTGSAPTSVTFGFNSNYTGGLSLGTIGINYTTGLWLRQGLSGISEPDPYASFRVNIAGYEQ